MSFRLPHTQEGSRPSGFSILMGTLVGMLSGFYLELFLAFILSWMIKIPYLNPFVVSLSPARVLALPDLRGTYLQWLSLDMLAMMLGGVGGLVGALFGYWRRKDLTLVVSASVAMFLAVCYALIVAGDQFFIPQALVLGFVPSNAGGLGGWYSVSKMAETYHRKHHLPIFILFLATCLTLFSLLFVYTINDVPRAGFPVPMIRDQVVSSPIVGQGTLGPEDTPTYYTILLNVLFYSIFLWLLQKVILRMRRTEKDDMLNN